MGGRRGGIGIRFCVSCMRVHSARSASVMVCCSCLGFVVSDWRSCFQALCRCTCIVGGL